jgi:phospholipase DDHD1
MWDRRFKALNPQGSVDYYLPSEGVNQYLEALSSHGSYWYDPRFATFVLTQLFASNEDLEKTGREEMGTEE